MRRDFQGFSFALWIFFDGVGPEPPLLSSYEKRKSERRGRRISSGVVPSVPEMPRPADTPYPRIVSYQRVYLDKGGALLYLAGSESVYTKT